MRRMWIVFACVAIASGVFASQMPGQVPAPVDLDEYGNHRLAAAGSEMPALAALPCRSGGQVRRTS